jgi:tripartite-type tricarboxylate transporter receptor subunit TctC
MMTMDFRLLALPAMALLIGVAPVQAQNWPQRPVKIIVPFAPGGNTDGNARLIAQPLSIAFKEQFVVENRPGANGVIAAEYVARAAPDGYTLFMASSPQIAIFPSLTKVPYDPVKDFAPISNIATSPFVLTVHKSMPAKSLKEFVDYVKARPGQLPYGSAGTGSLTHLSGALFLARAGLEMNHVVYKGGGPAMADLIAGQIPMYFANISEAAPHAEVGEIRLLGVSSLERWKRLPNVPTVAESGYPGFQTVTWNGLMAPAQTPPAIIARLAEECIRAMRDPALRERFASYGVEPLGTTSEQFARQIAIDIPAWAEAIKISGAKIE